MIKWTTPSLKCSIPQDIEFDYILLTLSQGNVFIEKRFEKESVVDNSFVAYFTQEETGQLNRNNLVEAQLNIMNGSTRLATNIVQLKITRNLHDEVIEAEPQPDPQPTYKVLIEDTIIRQASAGASSTMVGYIVNKSVEEYYNSVKDYTDKLSDIKLFVGDKECEVTKIEGNSYYAIEFSYNELRGAITERPANWGDFIFPVVDNMPEAGDVIKFIAYEGEGS